MTSVRLFGLVALTMVAFAANSILNRLALTDAAMGPASFAFFRLLSGAGCLTLMVVLRRAGWPRVSWPQAAALVVYALGFSFAYVALDAGFGALLLFGGVQVTMFAGAFVLRESLPTQRLTGGLIAFLGLVWLLWPNGASAPPLMPSVLMLTAAVAWGVYSLIGRGATDPLGDTAWAFVLATPVALGVAVPWPGPVGGSLRSWVLRASRFR